MLTCTGFTTAVFGQFNKYFLKISQFLFLKTVVIAVTHISKSSLGPSVIFKNIKMS